MKAFIQRTSPDINFTKLKEWGRLITMVGSAQVLVQALGLLSGILIIRLLPTYEYAFYTIANTMLGTMTLLADGGISSGVMSQGGQVWQNRQKLGAVIVTGLFLRKKFAVGSIIFATPILIYLLKHNGASWLMCILIALALIPAFLAALSDSLLEIVPKLHQDIARLQKNQISASLGRLIIISASLFIFPWTFVAIAGNGIPRIWANIQLRKISMDYADYEQKPDLIIQKEIMKIVKRIIPGAIYYCLSSQITFWLISLFGNTTRIAQIGALGRLSMVLNLFTILFATLITPRFARFASVKKTLLAKYIQIHISLFLLCGIILMVVYLFPWQILWILGKNYSTLKNELLLSVIGACLSLIAGSSLSLYFSRGWVLNTIISIPISIASIVCGALFINISTLQGLLLLNIIIAMVQLIMHGSYGLIKILKLKS